MPVDRGHAEASRSSRPRTASSRRPRRRRRGRAARPQRGRHADRVPRPGRACSTADRWVGGLFGYPELTLQTHPGHAAAPAGLGDGRALAGHVRTWGACIGLKHGRSTSSSPTPQFAHDMTRRALDPRSASSSRLRAAAASRTSPASASRSAASAAWPPSAGTRSPRFGLRAMIAGTLANFMTACIAGMLPVSAARARSERGGRRSIQARARAAAGGRPGARLGPGRLRARRWTAPTVHPLRRDPALPHLHRHRPQGRAGAGHVAGGVPVAVMAGRVHYYEGYTPAAGRVPGARAGPPGRARS